MNYVADKKEIEGVCRLQEQLHTVKTKDIEREFSQYIKNLAIAMLWSITQ